MAVTVKIDLSPIDSRLKQLGSEGTAALIRRIIKDSTPYVPKKSGDLRDSAQMKNGQAVWNTPYALELYKTPMRHYSTPGTTHHWVDKAASIHLNEWVKEIKGMI